MKKHFEVIITDDEWPYLLCKIGAAEKASIFDTSYPNFEVFLQNKLRVAVNEILQAHRQKAEYRPEETIPPPRATPQLKRKGKRL